MSDYQQDHDSSCMYCAHSPLHWRYCAELHCDEGSIDEYDDDPINFAPGKSMLICDECRGTGVEVWCPNCGQDLSGLKLSDDD